MKLEDSNLLRQQCYLNGQWVGGESDFPVHNPASGAELARVPRLGAAETRAAIAAADAAWPAWRGRTAKERAGVLRRWFELMNQHADDLALLMTSEQGKPLAEAKGEVAYAASFVEWFAEEAKRAYGETIPAVAADKRMLVIKQPIGVCAAITPWNFPAAMITRKVAPALAADPQHAVWALTMRQDAPAQWQGVRMVPYRPARGSTPNIPRVAVTGDVITRNSG